MVADQQSAGIVGCGAIAQVLLRAADERALPFRFSGVSSRTEASARAFLNTLATPSPPFLDLPALIACSDLIVETAGGHVVPELAQLTFTAGKDLMVISVGALLEHPEIIDQARRTGRRLIVPSGAIAGLDGIKGACMGRVDFVRLTSRKPPRALEGAPYLTARGLSVLGLNEERELFRGSAREACKGFPDNLNISAAISLAGIGPDLTEVRIIVAPGLERNCHDIEVEGEFGRLRVHIENIPSQNPRTGRLTALSILRSIIDATSTVRIGT
ncbi:MAG: aspartate dehydrogenase [Dehalococcoidia bacterium]|nr:aspartate dehydrogenase [Dehalococcoidia bacterium]